MKNLQVYLVALLFVSSIVLTSCEKEDVKVVIPKQDTTTTIFSCYLGPDYRNQVFVNLSDSTQLSFPQMIWDLSFSCDTNTFDITLNGGNAALIANAGFGKLKSNIDINKLKWRWDEASGVSDSLALSGWYNKNTKMSSDSVYVIDRGSNCSAQDRYMQFKILDVSAEEYTIAYTDIYAQRPIGIAYIPRVPEKLNVYFNFDKGGVILDIEPNKNDWDFCFIRYRTIYYDLNPPFPYLVNGIHINTYKNEAAVDSTLNFYHIDLATALSLPFKDRRDVMGFDWKVYDFNNQHYKARDFVNYILKPKDNKPGSVWKMRFTDFYNNRGQKGFPVFEVKKLN